MTTSLLKPAGPDASARKTCAMPPWPSSAMGLYLATAVSDGSAGLMRDPLGRETPDEGEGPCAIGC